MLLLCFHEVNNLLRWALARARVNIDRAGIEATAPFVVAYNKFNRKETILKYLLLLSPVRFSRLPDKVEKERVREKMKKEGGKSLSKRDRTSQSIYISMIKQEQR